MPRIDEESRRVRDVLILKLFLGGASYREIARAPGVNLSHRTVGDVIARELAVAPGQGALAVEARQMLLRRQEALLRVVMPKALAGDMDAALACLRVLDQQARLHGLRA